MDYCIGVLNDITDRGLRILEDKFSLVKSADSSEVDALLVRSAKVDTDRYPNLLAVARAGAGVDNISVNKATARGICVFNTPGGNANAVAELVFIMLGLYARRIDKALIFSRSLNSEKDGPIKEKVEAEKSRFTGFELSSKTLGVIGLGKIGTHIANAGIERGMRVIGYDAFPTITNMHRLNPEVEIARRMDEVFSQADILTVHVPLTDRTVDLISTKEILRMKNACILMNYARGGICNDNAVLAAINTNRIAAYLTDFPSQALLKCEKVICTPHLGASTAESEENCAKMAAKQLKNYLEYGIVTNSVNFPTIEIFPHQTTVTRLAIINRDVPNMIAAITSVLGSKGINIQFLTNESNGTIGYNLVDLNEDVPNEIVECIRRIENILRVRTFRFSK